MNGATRRRPFSIKKGLINFDFVIPVSLNTYRLRARHFALIDKCEKGPEARSREPVLLTGHQSISCYRRDKSRGLYRQH